MKHKTQIMNNLPLLNDLRVFMQVARRSGFAAVAQEMGVSPAFVSKRIALLEHTLNVVLLHRTTRRVSMTEEGERIYAWALRILYDVDQMMDELSDVRQMPQGMLRIISSFGFGRRVVAPALSALAKQYPQLELRFDVEDRLVDLANEGVDLDIRIGDDIAPNLIARKLGTNHRILCASPSFLAQHGTPKQLTELSACSCLVIKERDHPFGVWQLQNKEGQHAIKVTGALSSNHGEIVHQWCLDGQGLRYAHGGMSVTILPAVNWCRFCRSIINQQTSGPFMSPGWRTPRRYELRLSFCGIISPTAIRHFP